MPRKYGFGCYWFFKIEGQCLYFPRNAWYPRQNSKGSNSAIIREISPDGRNDVESS